MKKSTLLTVASVGAVALTSAMTFAAWDNLTATSTEAAVTFTQINVSETAEFSLSPATNNTNLETEFVPTADGTVTFGVTGLTEEELKNTQMTFVPKVMEGVNDVTGNCDVKIYESTDSSKSTNIAEGGDTSVDTTNAYTVVVSPKTESTDIEKVANKDLKVTVIATLEKTTQ